MIFTAREIRESDLPLVMAWRMDPGITKWMNTDPALTIEIQREWLARISEDETCRYWLLEVDGKPAGVLNLVDINLEDGVADWGYYIGARELRSMKLALSIELSLYQYCFEVLGLKKVVNAPHADNVATIKLHELCGCHVVGTRFGAQIKHGEQIDLVDMEISAENWNTSVRLKPYERIDLQ